MKFIAIGTAIIAGSAASLPILDSKVSELVLAATKELAMPLPLPLLGLGVSRSQSNKPYESEGNESHDSEGHQSDSHKSHHTTPHGASLLPPVILTETSLLESTTVALGDKLYKCYPPGTEPRALRLVGEREGVSEPELRGGAGRRRRNGDGEVETKRGGRFWPRRYMPDAVPQDKEIGSPRQRGVAEAESEATSSQVLRVRGPGVRMDCFFIEQVGGEWE